MERLSRCTAQGLTCYEHARQGLDARCTACLVRATQSRRGRQSTRTSCSAPHLRQTMRACLVEDLPPFDSRPPHVQVTEPP